MNILVTGANGFIGKPLVERLRNDGHTIFCQSRNCHADSLRNKWIKHNLISDSWDSLLLPHIDIVYHLAGQTSTYKAKQLPIADMQSNVIALLNLLEYFRRQDKKPFMVLAGTITEVGLADQLLVNETLKDKPITFYDISKLTAEMYLKQYVSEGFINGSILRLSNVYGRYQHGDQTDRRVLDKIFDLAIAGKKISIYGNGEYIRDYIFIDDVISALLLAPKNFDKTNGRSFCIGTGQGVTIKEAFLKVIALANKVTDVSVTHEFISPPNDLSPIEYRNVIVDATSFRKATGWTPQYNLDSGLNIAYEKYLSKPLKKVN